MGDDDGARIARGFGIFMSGGVWILCATTIREVMHSPGGLRIIHIAVTAGFFLGMYCYTQLCFAEGRARERADRERRERADRERRERADRERQ
jgi:hypothetical protein